MVKYKFRLQIGFPNGKQHRIGFETTEQARYYGGVIKDAHVHADTHPVMCVSDEATGAVQGWISGGPGFLEPDMSKRNDEVCSAFLRRQAGGVSIPDKAWRLMQATHALVQRYFATPGASDWTHAELEAAALEVAEVHQVDPMWVRGMFGKIITAR